MDFIEFWTICSSNGIILGKEQIWQLERYHSEMLYWNEKVNLISRKDAENFLEKHLLHSLSLMKYLDIRPKSRVLDVGTGGGLPGIPLAIANPEIFMLMVDSIKKKIKLTDMFAAHTGIRTLKAINTRVEDLSKDREYIRHFDLVVTRGVTKIPTILLWVEKLLKLKGKVAFYKGGDVTVEIDEALEIYPKLIYEVHEIKMLGAEWFTQDEKKIVICRFE